MNTNSSRINSMMPPVTMHLVIINAVLWVGTMLLGARDIVDLTSILGLHYWSGSDFHFYQFLTYMFMHDSSSFNAGFTHIFFNMFSLWMFGTLLEKTMGSARYLLFYIVCGIGAALTQEVCWHFTWQNILADINNVPTQEITRAIAGGQVDASFLNEYYNNLITVGASGAVFGILLAFGMLFPNIPMYIMFIPIPVKAKWMVIGYGALELVFGMTGAMSNVAHFAHLGGMLFGLIMIIYWKKTGRLYTHNGNY